MGEFFAGFGVIILLLVIFLFGRWSNRLMDRKQEKLLLEKTSAEAEARGCCMVRETYYEMPGVAQVLNGKLGIYTVLGDVIEIPMDQVKWLKNARTMLPYGRSSWWGKSCFKLETPKTSGLVLGFDDPGEWKRVFSANPKSLECEL